ncbi:MAG: hypothetical protein HYW02_07355 [Deltaproteobacteria bacterium]|nr:hypothetical protein [Deltaproteobacteria bacterium]MBI2501255.1 hypothetical protein [Deltaproteobacteria bacterium]
MAWIAAVIALAKQGIDGYIGQRVAETWADATRSIADINYESQTTIADRLYDSKVTTAGRYAEAYVDQSKKMVEGMLFAAQSQYDQSKLQMQYLDLQEKRTHSNWKRQVEQDLKLMTVDYSARIHARHLDHEVRTTKIYQAAELKQAKERAQASRPAMVNLNALFVS